MILGWMTWSMLPALIKYDESELDGVKNKRSYNVNNKFKVGCSNTVDLRTLLHVPLGTFVSPASVFEYK